ncbi:MAG: hypothetical protein FWB72_00365 [Firmicutes bacterium]|nr:hypothetical protein [Bacillota bacterium]
MSKVLDSGKGIGKACAEFGKACASAAVETTMKTGRRCKCAVQGFMDPDGMTKKRARKSSTKK